MELEGGRGRRNQSVPRPAWPWPWGRDYAELEACPAGCGRSMSSAPRAYNEEGKEEICLFLFSLQE